MTDEDMKIVDADVASYLAKVQKGQSALSKHLQAIRAAKLKAAQPNLLKIEP